MAKITLGLSPLTNIISAGRLNKAGTEWMGEKYDVTDACVMAIIGHVKKNRVIYEHDGKRFELKEIEIELEDWK